MAESEPSLDVKTVGKACVIELAHADMTDAAFIRRVGDDIYDIVKDVEAPQLVIDFGKVERLSSGTLGMLVALKKVVVERKGGQIRVCNVDRKLKDIFKMTRLDRQLKVCESMDEAVESL